MSTLLKSLGWIVATLAIAAVVHIASVHYLPRVIMGRTMAAISRGGVNTMLHAKRPTAQSRGVVRPSPDLLYSSCAYDLKKAGGALRVHLEGMPATYWSVSLFDADTNNFRVIDDRQAKGGTVDFLVVAADWEKPMPGLLVRAPGNRGLVLVRTLIDDETKFAAIDAARRHAWCKPYQPATP